MAKRFISMLFALTFIAACGDDAGTPKPTDDAGTITDSGESDAGTEDAGETDLGTEPECGNGVLEGDEVCDGAELDGATCSSEGATGGTLACNASCDGFDTSACTTCGDGLVEGDEVCDGDELNGATCTDEGFDSGDISCAADCTLDTSACSFDTCGDGVIQGNESCDGDELGAGTCMSEGFEGGTIACAGNCTYDTTACFRCGDMVLNGTEACDGPELGGETCISQGFEGGTLGCATDCTLDVVACYTCGDDLAEGPEECDGADLSGETCMTQGFAGGTLACGAACTLDTSACTTCGDDAINGADVCDGLDLGGETCVTQGFATGTLGCSANCGAFDTSACSSCGDGVANGTDACDGTDFAGASCLTLGFDAGTLSCTAGCAVDTAACIDYPAPAVGEVYITEFMYDPTAISDSNGEYIEIYNSTGNILALGDCEFRDSSNTYDIPAGTNVAPNTYFTIASSSSPGFTPDLDDLSFGLNNTGDTVAIWCPDTTGTLAELDSVTYDDGPNFPDAQGVSVSLDGALTGALETLNDTGSNWCFGRTAFGSGDLGTPGAANPSCAFCGNNLIDGTDVCDGTDLGTETCQTQGFDSGTLGCAPGCGAYDTSGCFNVLAPAAGEVVINELMFAPADPTHEFVELLNLSTLDLDMSGCELTSAAGTYTFAAGTTITAGSYFTLAASATPGFTPDLSDLSITFADAGDVVTLTCPDSTATPTTIDTVDYSGAAFAKPAGASVQYDADATAIDATLNDDGANWCATPATELLSTGDYATPGADNVSCAIVTYNIDFCRLQFPTVITETEGVSTTVYGRLYVAGLTNLTTSTDTAPTVLAQVGYGDDATDPATDTSWSWTDAVANAGYVASGNDEDEYQGELTTPPASGSPYDFAYRFSGDGGATWTYCDGTNGASDGSADGYQTANAGALVSNPAPVPTNLYFSEYIEGSSNNKALEIYNPDTTAQADLSQCSVLIYNNGGATPSTTIPLTGAIPADGVYTLCHSSFDTTLLDPTTCDVSQSLGFNGDDALELVCAGTTLDVIGQIGVDPGSAWSANGVSTQDDTIRRSCTVTTGDTNGADAFDPSVEWTSAGNNDVSDFGSYTCP